MSLEIHSEFLKRKSEVEKAKELERIQELERQIELEKQREIKRQREIERRDPLRFMIHEFRMNFHSTNKMASSIYLK